MSDAAAPNPEASTESSRSKRTIANRRNAQKSTGPKTLEGKRRSSLNAVTHGLHSNKILANCDAEERQGFRCLLADLHETYAPADVVEEMLVERIAGAWLRLARAWRFELRETQRAINIGGKRLPEILQRPLDDALFDEICRDPQVGKVVLDKKLSILQFIIKQIIQKGYLDQLELDEIKATGLYKDFLAFCSEDISAAAPLGPALKDEVLRVLMSKRQLRK